MFSFIFVFLNTKKLNTKKTKQNKTPNILNALTIYLD